MTARIAVALLLPLTASAQLVLVSWDGTTESVIDQGTTYDYGNVAAGDTKDAVFRARNTGSSAVTLVLSLISGGQFTLIGAPSSSTIAPGNFLEFTVGFTAGPAGLIYTAQITSNVSSINAFLKATSVPPATLTVLPGCTLADPIDFGRVQRGTLRVCSFSLANSTAQPVVTGLGFQGPEGLTVGAGGTVTFNINFTPPASIIYAGTLTIGPQAFNLTGSGFDPPLPTPTLQFDSANIGSGEQHTLTMSLPTPSPVTVQGLVTLTFTPATTVVTDDSSVNFVATSSRHVTFSVKQGDTQISLGGQTGAVFQTGTTAGTLTFSVSGTPIAGDPTTTLTIPPAIISLATVTASKRVNDLDIEVIGFDNTYAAGTMSFTFFDASGKTIGSGAIDADFTANFRSYFTTVTTGSSFLMLVTFPATGNASLVGAVQLDLMNSAGTAHTQQVKFQ